MNRAPRATAPATMKRRLRCARAVMALLLSALGATAAQASERSPATPCPGVAQRCFTLRWVAASSGDRSADQRWWAAQLARAQASFAAAGIEFEVRVGPPLRVRDHVLWNARDRDRVGRRDVRAGEILVISPLQVRDVPRRGQQRHGVHWRDRRDQRGEDQRRRWVIVANAARRPGWDMPIVLAHELGHFFGLPHSAHPDSLMNKAPGPRPPMSTWRFVRAQTQTVKRRADEMTRNGRLVTAPATGRRTAR